MRALVYRRYGPPASLRLVDVPDPVPTDEQVLVRVRAVALNPFDWHLLRGWPYFVRFTSGLRRPTRNIPGIDVAGVVEAVGRNVTDLKPGDEVYGEKSRSCAEYVSGPARLFVRKPSSLSFVEAAALPVAGVTALQALRDRGGVAPGMNVLVIGASGGVGTMAVQIAKAHGAQLTGVCSARNVELVRSIGADHVIDYTTTDVTKGNERFDLIIDIAGNYSVLALRRVLTSRGTLVMVGGTPGRWMIRTLREMALARVLTRLGKRRFLSHLTDTRQEDLQVLSGLVEAGRLRPVIDRTIGLEEVPDGLAYLETMRARGKVVATV
jgi:NADPH:quinone reductase-like Zn-dependent oxidoreductase